MNTTSNAPSEREEIEMLLPWYVTGRLERSEQERVAAYLERHPDMARQLDLVREELGETATANETVRMPSARGIEDLMAKVAAERRSSPRPLFSRMFDVVRGFFDAPSANAVRWAAAAAAVVVLAQAVTIGTLVTGREPAGTYQTASGGKNAAPTEGSFVLVRFASGATAGQIAAALSELKVSIADGPKPGGFFTLRIGDATLDEEARNRRISEMRSRSNIFVIVTPTR
ncbi:MAG: hypothetical protein RLZ98_2142 [Pseudomonadota bacterium]|jgi:hypothetical protein